MITPPAPYRRAVLSDAPSLAELVRAGIRCAQRQTEDVAIERDGAIEVIDCQMCLEQAADRDYGHARSLVSDGR